MNRCWSWGHIKSAINNRKKERENFSLFPFKLNNETKWSGRRWMKCNRMRRMNEFWFHSINFFRSLFVLHNSLSFYVLFVVFRWLRLRLDIRRKNSCNIFFPIIVNFLFLSAFNNLQALLSSLQIWSESKVRRRRRAFDRYKTQKPQRQSSSLLLQWNEIPIKFYILHDFCRRFNTSRMCKF